MILRHLTSGREAAAAAIANSGDIDRDAPLTGSATRRTQASPDRVWDVLADIDRWPGIVPGVRSARLAGPIAPGTTFRWVSGTPIRSTLRVALPGRELSWTGTALWFVAVHRNVITTEDTMTVLTSSESMSGPGIGAIMSSGKIATVLDEFVTAIVEEAERRTS